MTSLDNQAGGPSKAVSPPRARLAFRVGIVGHRPNRLPKDQAGLAALRVTIRIILEQAKDALMTAAGGAPEAELYSDEPPVLRAVSPLAEGSDRIFAEEALALGCELCCPMPFRREEFEKDFVSPAALEANSLARFRALLERAQSGAGLAVFELDGERSRAEEAYGAAGRVVLNQCDLLVAVWDGGDPAGRGGTVQTLREAIRFHVPVIWIDARAPDTWRLMHDESDLGVREARPIEAGCSALRDAVAQIVRDELCLPTHAATARPSATSSHAGEYFSERKPLFNFAFVWKLFRDLVGSNRITMPKIVVGDFEAQVRELWPTAEDRQANEGASPVSQWVNAKLRAHYAFADQLADLYADAHRSASILSYLFSALAVAVALLPMASGLGGEFTTLCIVCELLILSVIVALLGWGRLRHWHDRWMEYRLLAELIRQLRFLIPLGGGKPLPRIPAHLAIYGDPTQTWMYWHVRAIARQTGLPSARVGPDYVTDCLDFLRHMVGGKESGQWGFHLLAERRSRTISSRLRTISLFSFALTIAAVGLHLFLQIAHGAKGVVPPEADRWLVLASASLPALGAAVAGINNQGEFTRIAKRSAAMASGFEKFAAQIAALRGRGAPKLAEATQLSSKIAEAMVEEVVDWRAVFIDRPQEAG